MKPEEIRWKDFVSHALPVHILAEYWYCAPKILARKVVGEVETPIQCEGKRLHEEEAQQALAKLGPVGPEFKPETLLDMLLSLRLQVAMALKRRVVLANAKDRVLVRCATSLWC